MAKKTKKLNETLGALEEDERFSWKSGRLPEVLGEEEEKRGGGKKKHQLDTKSVEQNKRRLKEMTSHSPSFPLIPQLVQETVSGCRDTMGSAHVRRLTGAVAGRGGGGRRGSLHRHDVLDKGCDESTGERDDECMTKNSQTCAARSHRDLNAMQEI